MDMALRTLRIADKKPLTPTTRDQAKTGRHMQNEKVDVLRESNQIQRCTRERQVVWILPPGMRRSTYYRPSNNMHPGLLKSIYKDVDLSTNVFVNEEKRKAVTENKEYSTLKNTTDPQERAQKYTGSGWCRNGGARQENQKESGKECRILPEIVQ